MGSALDKVLISYRLATDQDKADKFLSKGQLMFKKRKRRMKLYARAKKKVFTYRMQTKTVVAQLETLARSNKLQGPLIRSQLMAARKAAAAKAAKEAQVSDPLAQLSHMIGSFDQVAGVWGSSMIAPPPPPPETFHGPNAKAAQQAVAGVKQATNDFEREKLAQVAKERASIIDGFANGPGSSTMATGSTGDTHPTKPASPPPPPGPDAVQIKLDADWKRLQKEDAEKKQEAKGKKQEAKGVSELSSDR